MSKRKHWSSQPGYNQRWWAPEDWADWEKAGRPKLPVGNRLGFGDDTRVKLDVMPVTAPLRYPVDVTGPSRSRAEQRSAAVDEWLASHGFKTPRRRTHETEVKRKRVAEAPSDGVLIKRNLGAVKRVF